MEAHGTGPQYLYDRVKQALRLHTDRGSALREAALACRKGGTLTILRVYGVIDKFPLGVVLSKGLTVRSALQYAQRYMEPMMRHVLEGELDPTPLITHRMPLRGRAARLRRFQAQGRGLRASRVRAVGSGARANDRRSHWASGPIVATGLPAWATHQARVYLSVW
jgi:threonine dehydrogenase-like Zn-dependent dehydrogenase